MMLKQLTTPENSITRYNALLSPQNFQFLLGVKIASRETENNVLMERPRHSLSSGVAVGLDCVGKGNAKGSACPYK